MDWLAPLFSIFEVVPGFRALLGIIIVFFLPGFAWTLVFFRGINVLERVILSIGLSIAIVALSILALHKALGMAITGLNSLLVILLVTIIPLAIYYLKRFMGNR